MAIDTLFLNALRGGVSIVMSSPILLDPRGTGGLNRSQLGQGDFIYAAQGRRHCVRAAAPFCLRL